MDSNDTTVKARTWDEFIGQRALKLRLGTHIRASIAEERPLEHILLTGPPGSGKTTLAELIAQGTGDPLRAVTMPIDRKALIEILMDFTGGILFLDEIHAMAKKDQEMLLPVLGRGVYVNTRGDEFEIPWLTVIGATTERDKVITPLLERFILRPEVEAYTDTEMGWIVQGMAIKARVNMDPSMARELGAASGGIPRNAKQFVFAARALAATTEDEVTATDVLALCVVDPDGLSELHNRYLALLDSQGGRAGSRTIEGLLQIQPIYARELERLLIGKGFITYTPSGRVLTRSGTLRARREVQRTMYSRTPASKSQGR